MADDEVLDFLERRVTELENNVFGNSEKDADYPKSERLNKTVIDSLLDIQKKISTSLSGKKKAVQIYEKLPDLKNLLDHRYTDEMMLSNDAREETVLSASDFLETQSALLKTLSEHQDHINSEHVQAVPKLSSSLHTVSQVQIEQQDELTDLSEETRTQLGSYNNLITLISKQFIMWDEKVTNLELQAQKR